ncbi:MAG: hypothetical protein WCL49_12655 [bacterium]
MTIPILCLVCLFFLFWILILKSEVNHLKKDLDRSKAILKSKLGSLKEEVKIDQGQPLKGRAAEGSLLRFP